MSQLLQAYGITKGIEAQRRAKPIIWELYFGNSMIVGQQYLGLVSIILEIGKPCIIKSNVVLKMY